MARKTSSRFVALLRGINVGGKNRLPMKELVGLVEGLGAAEVSSYIQSGNVVFSASATAARDLPEALAAAIHERYGYTVPVVLRRAKELRAVVEGNPFLAEGAEPKTCHVAFLARTPTKAAAAALDPDRSPGDRFVLRGKDLFLHFPSGVAKSKLTNAYLDRTLGTVSTVRNWRTVGELLARADP